MKFKESETLELKKSTAELKEAVISIVAMLNKHRRGKLYFGINNDGQVVGQTVSGQTIKRCVQSRLRRNRTARIPQNQAG